MLYIQQGFPVLVSSGKPNAMDNWCISAIRVFSTTPNDLEIMEDQGSSRALLKAKYFVGPSTMGRVMYLFKDIIKPHEREGCRVRGAYTITTTYISKLIFYVEVNNTETTIILSSDGTFSFYGKGYTTFQAANTKQFVRFAYKVKAHLTKGVEIVP